MATSWMRYGLVAACGAVVSAAILGLPADGVPAPRAHPTARVSQPEKEWDSLGRLRAGDFLARLDRLDETLRQFLRRLEEIEALRAIRADGRDVGSATGRADASWSLTLRAAEQQMIAHQIALHRLTLMPRLRNLDRNRKHKAAAEKYRKRHERTFQKLSQALEVLDQEQVRTIGDLLAWRTRFGLP